MEGSSTGVGRMDTYEDMFKEITRKLYGDDPDHRTSSVQNEFETSVSYKTEDDTGNGTDGSDEDNWTCEEEPLKGTDGSRIAAYHAGKATWRCYECGDVMGGGPREVADHFMELHSSRILTDDNRNRDHLSRKDYLPNEVKQDDVVSYLERLRERAETAAPPSRRTQETQTTPAALLPVSSPFLLQELPSVPVPQHLHQNSPTMASGSSNIPKRYMCPYCPYGTDRRDLYTRHENIHREEKPFHCYICFKPFNRADHVKKHFIRMHRDQCYDLSKIRKNNTSRTLQQDANSSGPSTSSNGQQQQQQQHATYATPGYSGNKNYPLQSNHSTGTTAGTSGIYQPTTMPTPGIMQPDANNCGQGKRIVNNGGCNSKSHQKGGSKSTQERRYSCTYCTWTGVDNWCLKRHFNTHLRPFACSLCEYKAARSERLTTHVLKVHNRNQCSKCTFVGHDVSELQVHQMQMHRGNNANSQATNSAAQTPPLPTNRQQQPPIHPAAGGRPPPGPPVFPAPAPAITPATAVIPPSTLLGHEMVKSPATAATMAYPLEEEIRRSWVIEYLDNFDKHGNEKGKDSGEYDRYNDDDNYSIEITKDNVVYRDHLRKVLSSNRHFTCSNLRSTDEDILTLAITQAINLENLSTKLKTIKPKQRRRSRKQRKPKRAVTGYEISDTSDTLDENRHRHYHCHQKDCPMKVDPMYERIIDHFSEDTSENEYLSRSVKHEYNESPLNLSPRNDTHGESSYSSKSITESSFLTNNNNSINELLSRSVKQEYDKNESPLNLSPRNNDNESRLNLSPRNDVYGECSYSSRSVTGPSFLTNNNKSVNEFLSNPIKQEYDDNDTSLNLLSKNNVHGECSYSSKSDALQYLSSDNNTNLVNNNFGQTHRMIYYARSPFLESNELSRHHNNIENEINENKNDSEELSDHETNYESVIAIKATVYTKPDVYKR